MIGCVYKYDTQIPHYEEMVAPDMDNVMRERASIESAI